MEGLLTNPKAQWLYYYYRIGTQRGRMYERLWARLEKPLCEWGCNAGVLLIRHPAEASLYVNIMLACELRYYCWSARWWDDYMATWWHIYMCSHFTYSCIIPIIFFIEDMFQTCFHWIFIKTSLMPYWPHLTYCTYAEDTSSWHFACYIGYLCCM